MKRTMYFLQLTFFLKLCAFITLLLKRKGGKLLRKLHHQNFLAKLLCKRLVYSLYLQHILVDLHFVNCGYPLDLCFLYEGKHLGWRQFFFIFVFMITVLKMIPSNYDNRNITQNQFENHVLLLLNFVNSEKKN